MDTVSGFVAHIRKFNGKEVFLLSGDADFLKWFARALSEERFLTAARPLVLGDGAPVSSDGRCLIEAVPGASTTLRMLADGHYRWQIEQEELAFCREKVEAMIESDHPCHPYFDMYNPPAPTIVVSTGEYPDDVIRAMRDGR